MASTGVGVDDAVVSQYNDMKLGRLGAKYITYLISDGRIVTDKVGPSSASFNDFVAAFAVDGGCSYAILDMNFTTRDGRPGNKLVFISWSVLK
jgi:Cofilin/tropomyosin-type actin-binding protein